MYLTLVELVVIHSLFYQDPPHNSIHLHRACFFLLLAIIAPDLKETVTGSFASFIYGVQADHLSDVVLRRSKRMILDNIGVGLLGSTSHVFDICLNYCQVIST